MRRTRSNHQKSLRQRRLFLLKAVLLVCILVGCSTKHREWAARDGYRYKLIGFAEQTKSAGLLVRARVAFKTQRDSVFWDSKNQFNDLLFLHRDSTANGMLNELVFGRNDGDSLLVMAKTGKVFEEVFNSPVPRFLANDSVVIALIGIHSVSPQSVSKSISHVKEAEQLRLRPFKTHDTFEDANGIIWLSGRPSSKQHYRSGDRLLVEYAGSFIDGRQLDKSPNGFSIIFGAPDQLVEGLNFVTRVLEPGATAKIVLPSRLAYGARGSLNQMVPPFTPLMYKIKITLPDSAFPEQNSNR